VAGLLLLLLRSLSNRGWNRCRRCSPSAILLFLGMSLHPFVSLLLFTEE
jgi:hypothetical protein